MNKTVLDLINDINIENIKKTVKNDEKCVECKSTETKVINGELICSKCGLVLSSPNQYVAGRKIDLPLGLNLSIE